MEGSNSKQHRDIGTCWLLLVDSEAERSEASWYSEFSIQEYARATVPVCIWKNKTSKVV